MMIIIYDKNSAIIVARKRLKDNPDIKLYVSGKKWLITDFPRPDLVEVNFIELKRKFYKGVYEYR